MDNSTVPRNRPNKLTPCQMRRSSTSTAGQSSTATGVGNAQVSFKAGYKKVDGKWGPWTEWAKACSRTCGGGYRIRSRECNFPRWALLDRRLKNERVLEPFEVSSEYQYFSQIIRSKMMPWYLTQHLFLVGCSSFMADAWLRWMYQYTFENMQTTNYNKSCTGDFHSCRIPVTLDDTIFSASANYNP